MSLGGSRCTWRPGPWIRPNVGLISFTLSAKLSCPVSSIMDQLLASLPENVPASHNITAIAVAYGEANLAQGQPEAIFSGLEDRVRPFREAGFLRQLADEYWLRGRAEMELGLYTEAREALLKVERRPKRKRSGLCCGEF
jgi:hypothetical protein